MLPRKPTTAAPRGGLTARTTSRRERLFIFLLGVITGLTFLNVHEKHKTITTAALSSSSEDERLRLRRAKSNDNFNAAATAIIIGGDDDDDDDDDNDERTRRRSDDVKTKKSVASDSSSVRTLPLSFFTNTPPRRAKLCI